MLTVVFPQRFHIFLPRFRLRILDISSCDEVSARAEDAATKYMRFQWNKGDKIEKLSNFKAQMEYNYSKTSIQG